MVEMSILSNSNCVRADHGEQVQYSVATILHTWRTLSKALGHLRVSELGAAQSKNAPAIRWYREADAAELRATGVETEIAAGGPHYPLQPYCACQWLITSHSRYRHRTLLVQGLAS